MEKKLATYGADYGGLLSNSMLQAAIVCPLKYKLMYVDGIRPDKDGFYWNAAFIGNVLHRAIELHDDNHEAIQAEAWDILKSYFGADLTQRTRNLMAAYHDAIKATQAEGIRQRGEPYKAPEMTGYWKKNYAGLMGFLDKLNDEAERHIEGSVFEEPYIDLIKRMFICMENWKGMRIDAPIAAELLLTGEVGPPDARLARVGAADRIERRENGRSALCDFKTGKWAYDRSKTANSDQFGLYHRLLEQTDYGAPVEWVTYNLFTGETVRVVPNDRMLEKFDNRLATNQRYFKQLKLMIDAGIEVPTPAGAAFKTGCPCILAKTGDCNYVYMED